MALYYATTLLLCKHWLLLRLVQLTSHAVFAATQRLCQLQTWASGGIAVKHTNCLQALQSAVTANVCSVFVSVSHKLDWAVLLGLELDLRRSSKHCSEQVH